MPMVYKFRESHPRFCVDPQTVGERLETIRAQHNDRLNPTDVVEDARPRDSPLHPVFEWDDAKAAETHRRRQASELIRSVRVVMKQDTENDEGSEKMVADQSLAEKRMLVYVSVKSPEGQSHYVTIARAFSDEDMRQQVLNDAIRQFEQLRSRYANLSELSDIFQAIDDIGSCCV